MSQEITNIFSKRLKQARKMRGMSLDSLSHAIGNAVTRQAISKYEQGRAIPNSKTLLALASALGVKIDFLFRPYAVEVSQIDFRKKAKCSDAKCESLKERVQEEMERYLEIEQMCGSINRFTLVKQDARSVSDVPRIAADVRAAFKLGSDGISNVIEVLENNGVKVVEIEEADSVDGLCGYVNDTIPIIMVNSRFSPERKRFTVLHELGHLIMNFPDSMDGKEVESICNAFANEMLLPHSELIDRIGTARHDISMAELTDIQKLFGISIDAIMYRLHQQGVISANRFKTFNIKKNTDKGFKDSVQKSRIPQEHSGRFARMVYRALADEAISISKAASLLNTSVDKVQAHLQLV